jgi:3-methyladenine DNA glycosylase AlkD
VTSAVFDAAAAASQVVAALLPQADSERAGQAKRYLKSDLAFLGVSVPAIRSAVRDVARTRPELDRVGALAWARALWREPVHERRTAAIEVLRWYTRRLLPADLALVEAWVREAHGWAYVDPPAGDIAGPIALAHPDAWPLIDAWATAGRPSAGCPLSRPPGCRPCTPVVKDTLRRSFRENSANPGRYLSV